MGKMVQTAIDFAISDLARLLLALVVTVGLVLLLLGHITPPEAYWVVEGAVIGFYFGGNVGKSGGVST